MAEENKEGFFGELMEFLRRNGILIIISALLVILTIVFYQFLLFMLPLFPPLIQNLIMLIARNFGLEILDYVLFICGILISYFVLISLGLVPFLSLQNLHKFKNGEIFLKNFGGIFLLLIAGFFTVIIIPLILLLIFSTGAKIIDDSFGEKEMKLNLTNCSNVSQKLGEINCKNAFNENVIAGEQVTCNFSETDFNFSNGSVNFIFTNGSFTNEVLTHEIKFIVPENLARTAFKLNGVLENKTACLSGEHNEGYPNDDEFMENKEIFIQLMGTLFGFVLVVMYGLLQIVFKMFNMGIHLILPKTT